MKTVNSELEAIDSAIELLFQRSSKRKWDTINMLLDRRWEIQPQKESDENREIKEVTTDK